jgi:hypothetical protein
MSEHKRVLDVQTGHEYSTSAYNPAIHVWLRDEPAVDPSGMALPAKPTPTPGPLDVEPDADREAREAAEAAEAAAKAEKASSSGKKQGTAQGGSTTTGGN